MRLRRSTWIAVGLAVVAVVMVARVLRPARQADAWAAAAAARWIMDEEPDEAEVVEHLGTPESPDAPRRFDPAKLVTIDISGRKPARSGCYYNGRLEVRYDDRGSVACIGVSRTTQNWVETKFTVPTR